jgi:uncharacterized membrane protein YvbJ
MSMVFCRGCGKEIHETAVSCPQCGAIQNSFLSKEIEKTHLNRSKESVNPKIYSIFGLAIVWGVVFSISIIAVISIIMVSIIGLDAQKIIEELANYITALIFSLSFTFTYFEKLPGTSGAQEIINELISKINQKKSYK